MNSDTSAGEISRNDESHYSQLFQSRHFEETVEIWCPIVDETKVVLRNKYTRYCPMCGEKL